MTQQVDAVVSDEVAGGDVVRKKVDELSLDEIKAELERRKLDFSGDDYAILHERLTDSMVEEGLDPAVHEFELEAEEDEDEEDEEATPAAEQADDAKADDEAENSKPADEGAPTKRKDSPVLAGGSSVTGAGCTAVNNDNDNSNNDNDNNNTTPGSKKKEQPAAKKSPTAQMQYKEVPGNHLWVSGLSSRCKAADLKKFFARYANVGSAKIVANARTTSAHCYGYITVESPADLEKCVQKLHSTRFEGSLIRVEICKLAPADQLRKVEMKNRERLAQQKEEFRKRKEERKRKIDEEMKRREELERRKELEKRREEDRKKHEGKRREDDVKKEHKKDDRKPPERRRTRSRSPFDRRRPQPFRRQELIRRPGGPPPPRRFNSPPGHRRGSPPYVRNRPRRMSPPSPFGRAPPAPFVHGPPVVERMPGIDRGRMIERDRRIDDERFEVERRQRAEADALERERRQLRMEEERLEREKLDLIRLERERVKKEMEEVAARKDLAERRRQEELRRQQEEERKREELRLEMERRAPREPPRPPMPPTAAGPIELYDPRLPLPVEDYSRAQAEDKFAGRLGPPLQRDQAAPRHDDRRRDDRRREPPIMSRDDRRPPESLDPWNASDLKSRGSGDYLDQRARHDTQLVQPPKRMRSRSPQRTGVTNSGYGVLSAADYGMSRGPSASDSWPPQGSRGPMSSMPSTSFLDSRRAPPPPVATRTPEVPPSGGSQWSSNAARVAFPPSYGHQESSRGLLGSTSVPSIGSFGLGALPTSGFRRY